VNGDNVTAMGLFVEHYQENLDWKGEKGRVYFYQNELPYDPPTQAEWGSYPGYKVDVSVEDHEMWAGGVYCYNRNRPSIFTNNGFKVPDKTNVNIHGVFTRNKWTRRHFECHQ
jgi:hypothetical protein